MKTSILLISTKQIDTPISTQFNFTWSLTLSLIQIIFNHFLLGFHFNWKSILQCSRKNVFIIQVIRDHWIQIL